MIGIRRIEETEAAAVAELWDRMCRELPDGGPLPPGGRERIAAMLAASAWHHQAFCLVAVLDDEVVGFANGRLDPGDGLLPGLAGELESAWVRPEHRGTGLTRRLAEAGVGWLRERGAGTVRTLVCADNPDAVRFWTALGFEADMTCLSLYAER
jgi:GNAT superfamily N-acetyltransferase